MKTSAFVYDNTADEFMYPSVSSISEILGTPTKQRVSDQGTILNVSTCNSCVVVV